MLRNVYDKDFMNCPWLGFPLLSMAFHQHAGSIGSIAETNNYIIALLLLHNY
jgi:hypothetical protein